MQTDVLIVGGGLGGCAAALAITRMGYRAILTEESDWIGGQLTSQAVPPDEHGWIERFGCTAAYRQLRNAIREYYQRYYPLSAEALNKPALNPGNGWVSPLCHEPRVALAVLEAMLGPAISSGRLLLWRRHRPVACDVDGDLIRSVEIEDLETRRRVSVTSRFVLDATELGDLLPLSGVEFVTGAESQAQTGEPGAPARSRPENVQAFSFCFAMDYLEGEDHTIERPNRYEYWKNYVPALTPPWPGPLLSFTTPNPRTMQPNAYSFVPHREEAKAFSGLWTYRRILDRTNFTDGFFPSDVCLVNWPLIDYLEGDLCSASEVQKATYLKEAKELSLSVFYWLQTEAPRADGGRGWKGLRLRGDLSGTTDGLAKMPYIRESRRINALFTITENDVSAALRPEQTLAAHYDDSVGVGYYRIDLHPSTGGDNYIDVAALPFQIPLRSLIPIRLKNLIAAGKNIGTTHITNGCYRLHPVEWNIGESAGALAAFAIKYGAAPASVTCGSLLQDFQAELMRAGVELRWPGSLVLEEGDAHIHAR